MGDSLGFSSAAMSMQNARHLNMHLPYLFTEFPLFQQLQVLLFNLEVFHAFLPSVTLSLSPMDGSARLFPLPVYLVSTLQAFFR